MSVNKAEYFCILFSTCMNVFVGLLCLFIHELPCQTVVVCCYLFFSGVLPAWATVPFSTLQWRSLRLVPTNLLVTLQACCKVLLHCNTSTYIPLTLEMYPLGEHVYIVLGDIRKIKMVRYCHKISQYDGIVIVTKF